MNDALLPNNYLLKALRAEILDPRRGYKSDATILLNPHGPPAADALEAAWARIAELEAENARLRTLLAPEVFAGGHGRWVWSGLPDDHPYKAKEEQP